MTSIPGWSALKSRWTAIAPRWKAILALIMVFAAGAAGGALVEDIADDLDRPFAEADDDDNDDGETSEENILANLSLTPEQRTGIERAFEAREDRLERYWDAQLPSLDAVIDSSREEVRSLLTAEQRTIYDSQVTRLQLYSRRGLREEHDD
jgi:Spy/CpxP family protein refolding chaperone